MWSFWACIAASVAGSVAAARTTNPLGSDVFFLLAVAGFFGVAAHIHALLSSRAARISEENPTPTKTTDVALLKRITPKELQLLRRSNFESSRVQIDERLRRLKKNSDHEKKQKPTERYLSNENKFADLHITERTCGMPVRTAGASRQLLQDARERDKWNPKAVLYRGTRADGEPWLTEIGLIMDDNIDWLDVKAKYWYDRGDTMSIFVRYMRVK